MLNRLKRYRLQSKSGKTILEESDKGDLVKWVDLEHLWFAIERVASTPIQRYDLEPTGKPVLPFNMLQNKHGSWVHYAECAALVMFLKYLMHASDYDDRTNIEHVTAIKSMLQPPPEQIQSDCRHVSIRGRFVAVKSGKQNKACLRKHVNA